MRQGALISAGAHVVLVLAAIIGLPEAREDATVIPPRVTDVSIVALNDFEAAQSKAPSPVEDTQLALNAPEPDSSQAVTPATEPPLKKLETPKPTPPVKEADPDLSSLDAPEPNVETDIVEPSSSAPEAPLGIDSPLPDGNASDGSLNSNSASLVAPDTPNLAPRIDTTAAPKPPKPVPQAAEEQPSKQPDPEPEPEPTPEPVEQAAAPEEATTEITPDAVKQDRVTQPKAATRPRGRPTRPKPEVASSEEKPQEKEPAQQSPETETSQQVSDAAPSPEQGSRLGQDFSSSEARSIGDAIGKSWNKTLIEGKNQYERLVVIVRVKLTEEGRVIGSVEPVQPRSPNGDFKVAYEAARRAVLRAQPIPLPKDKFRTGDFLEIRFDPGRSAISLD